MGSSLYVVTSYVNICLTTAMQGIMYTQLEPSHVNGAAFPSFSLYTITSQYICEVQTRLEMTQSTLIYGKQGSVDPSPPYTE